MSERPWTDPEFREAVAQLLDRIEAGNVETAAMDLWRAAFSEVNRWIFAEGLWNIWGGISDEYTHPRGDAAGGDRLTKESGSDLRLALGDESKERSYCDTWVKRICG